MGSSCAAKSPVWQTEPFSVHRGKHATWRFTNKFGAERPQTALKPGKDCQKLDFAAEGCAKNVHEPRAPANRTEHGKGPGPFVAERTKRSEGLGRLRGGAISGDSEELGHCSEAGESFAKRNALLASRERSTLFIGVPSFANASRETFVRGAMSNDPARGRTSAARTGDPSRRPPRP